MKVTVNEKTHELTIVAQMAEDPQPSKSGKTKLVVTTAGALKTDAKVNGQPLTINLNAYIPNS